jgi:hypothetical protein
MKRELVELHDMDPAKIFVGGAVQFDHYFQDGYVMSRQDLLSKFGLCPDRKIIYFATKSPTLFPWNPDITRTIAEAIHQDRFESPCQLLVRLHPIHFRMKNGQLRFEEVIESYGQIAREYDHVTINSPTMQSKNIAFDMPQTECTDVASILHHSDVMVNVFSTMNLEASIFDLPTINVGFNGMNQSGTDEAWLSVEVDERQTHNQRVLKTGGVRLARSGEELIEFINMYVKTPETDREGRTRMVEQECGPNRGEAGLRVANYVSELFQEL